MTVILLFKFSSARPSNCSVKLVKMLSENFSANWVKLAAVLGSLNQHSFLSVTDSENRTCRDFKESGHSGITCKIKVMKTPIRWETSGFCCIAHTLNFYLFAKIKEERTNLLKIQICMLWIAPLNPLMPFIVFLSFADRQ